MTDYIDYNYYSKLANRVIGWCNVNGKLDGLTLREVYNSPTGRTSDPETILRICRENYENNIYFTDDLCTELFECLVNDEEDYGFLPTVVTGDDGRKWSDDEMIDFAERVSNYEVVNGASPSIIYIKSPQPQPSPVKGKHTQILNMNAKPARQGFAQNTGYNCAPNSVQCIIYYLTGLMIDEQKLASVGGTTKSGTGHGGINTMIQWFNRNYDPTLSIEWASFNDYGFSGVSGLFEAPNTGVFFHLLYRNKWGHYEVPRVINMDNNQIEVYNSLSGGYVENRNFNTQRSYINGISQPGLCIIRRTD